MKFSYALHKFSTVCIILFYMINLIATKICYENSNVENYFNCDTIEGNLIIENTSDENLIEYIKSVKHVTGYILIRNISIPILNLPNLKFIDGNTLFKSYSLVVENNFISNSLNGLKYVEFPSLIEISSGNVLFKNNRMFCKNLKNHILWDDIFISNHQKIEYIDDLPKNEQCDIKCPKRCSNGNIKFSNFLINFFELQKINKNLLDNLTDNYPYCWSPSSCQTFTKLFCHNSCFNSRCTQPFTCCGLHCKGLCKDDEPNKCLDGCRNYMTGDAKNFSCLFTCLDESYESSHLVFEDKFPKTPNLYQFDHLCVNRCPNNTFMYENSCVFVCPFHKGYINQGYYCRKCTFDGFNPLVPRCYQLCQDVKDLFKKRCEVYMGNLHLTNITLYKYDIDDEEKLLTRFTNLKYITGSLILTDLPPPVKSLDFFTNLEAIYGKEGSIDHTVLHIQNTYLKYIGLPKLRLGPGKIRILHNTFLCHVNTLNWNTIQLSSGKYNTFFPENSVEISNNGFHHDNCKSDDKNNPPSGGCDKNCDLKLGCWGPGPKFCSRCRLSLLVTEQAARNNSMTKETALCVDRCPKLFTQEMGVCVKCNPECNDLGCENDTPSGCHRCRNYEFDGQCINKCPLETYPSTDGSMKCLECSRPCYLGCTGPETFVGFGGCNFCRNGAFKINANFTQCNPLNMTHCPRGSYSKWTSKLVKTERVPYLLNHTQCIRCHKFCAECMDDSRRCPKCKYVRLFDSFYPPSPEDNVTSIVRDYPHTGMTPFYFKNFGECEFSCPVGYYELHLGPHYSSNNFGKSSFERDSKPEIGCFKCSEQCKISCNGPGPSNCLHACLHYKLPSPHSLSRLDAILQETVNASQPSQHQNFKINLWLNSLDKDFTCVIACPRDISLVHLNSNQSICHRHTQLIKLLHSDLGHFSAYKRYLSIPPIVFIVFLAVIFCCCFKIGFSPFTCKYILCSNHKGKKFDYTRCHFSPDEYGASYSDKAFTADVPRGIKYANNQLYESRLSDSTTDISDYQHNQNGSSIGNGTLPAPNEILFDKTKIIKDEQLTLGSLLGSGAFGTVNKGIYKTENREIPVAIKTLVDGDLLKKANEVIREMNMLSYVQHKYLLSSIGICLVPEFRMITEFVELGNLLDYLRKALSSTVTANALLRNKEHLVNQNHIYKNEKYISELRKTLSPISWLSKHPPIDLYVLIQWSDQIAQGMAYLEKNQLVHRDLAARNILVKALDHIVISDFGSARILKDGNNVYASKGGRMPYKWLSIETIETLIFTHKSDVWAYGVTLWEIFSFGEHPYEHVKAPILLKNLKKGRRLPQPSFAPSFIYQLMRKCWEFQPLLRPDFQQIHRNLNDALEKISQNPETLNIPNFDDQSFSKDYSLDFKTDLNYVNESHNFSNNSHLPLQQYSQYINNKAPLLGPSINYESIPLNTYLNAPL